MPKEIVTETSRVGSKRHSQPSRSRNQAALKVMDMCPAPECNLGQKDVKQFWKEFMKYMKLFQRAFGRKEQRKRSQAYVHGLLGDAQRKNVEQMALEVGENVRSLQYFVGQSPWEVEPVIAVHQGLMGESLGEEDGVVLIDESSAVKQGADSVGVAAQYCGSVGKIANGQVGVYLGYASRKGYSLIEGHLFMPEAWFDQEHVQRRQTCGVPEELVFQTKPEIGLELVKNAKKRYHLNKSGKKTNASQNRNKRVN